MIHAGLHNAVFVERATEGFEAYAESVEPFTLAEGERLTGVPADVIREIAIFRARRPRDDLLDAGDHRAPQRRRQRPRAHQPRAPCGHVGRYGSGLNPLRGQNHVQAGAHGRDPRQVPRASRTSSGTTTRAPGSRRRGRADQAPLRVAPDATFEAMERGELRTLYVIGVNPAQSEADISKAWRLLSELDLLVVQDIVMTRTAEMAMSCSPGPRRGARRRAPSRTASGASSGCARCSTRRGWHGRHLESSRSRDHPPRPGLGRPAPPRRRGRAALALAAPSGHALRPAGGARGNPVAVPRRGAPGLAVLHARLWAEPVDGPRAPFSVVGPAQPPFEALDDEYPIRLTTGRRLESFNTGAQSGLYRSPLHAASRSISRPRTRRGCCSRTVRSCASRPAAGRWRRRCGSTGRPRGARVHDVPLPRRGRRQPADDRRDRPEVGTAEFKAAAIRIEKLAPAEAEAASRVPDPVETTA